LVAESFLYDQADRIAALALALLGRADEVIE
jgi:hypothetical protein